MLKDFISDFNNPKEDYSFIISSVSQKIKREFYKTPKEDFLEFISVEPEFQSKELGSFCCGLIEMLCNKKGLEVPKWVYSEEYFLESPFDSIHKYRGVYEKLRDTTLEEFKRRNYFTNESGILV